MVLSSKCWSDDRAFEGSNKRVLCLNYILTRNVPVTSGMIHSRRAFSLPLGRVQGVGTVQSSRGPFGRCTSLLRLCFSPALCSGNWGVLLTEAKSLRSRAPPHCRVSRLHPCFQGQEPGPTQSRCSYGLACWLVRLTMGLFGLALLCSQGCGELLTSWGQ